MAVVSFKTLEEQKQTCLRQITFIFYGLNYDLKIDLPIYIELALKNTI